MNKAELVEAVQANLQKSGIEASKAMSESAVKAVLEGITEGLKTSGSVQLIGFGTFAVAERAARQGYNPQAGKVMEIKASKTVKFKVGAKLKEVI